MLHEGQKRNGRFIKKDSRVLEKVSLVEFRFAELNSAKVIGHDNSKRTIIHSQYHELVELKETVQSPDKFNETLDTEQKRPVIMPSDFTADWERTRKLRKDRIARHDDEEYDFEYEQQRIAQEVTPEVSAEAAAPAASSAPAAGMTPPSAAATPEAKNLTTNPAGSSATTAAQAKPAAPAAGTPSPQQQPQRGTSGMVTGTEKQWEYMDQVGQAIKNLKNTAPEAPSQAPQRPPLEPGSDVALDHPEAPTAHAAAQATDDFIPVATGEASVQDPEIEAARAYRRRLEIEQQHKAQLDELAEKAKAEGFRDGFRMGEEKAETQVRQNAAQVFGKVNELIQEFGKLKHEILNNVQGNFYELCQAMAEALIKREFSINPETFAQVLRRAISEGVEPGKVRIRVHPEMYDRLVSLGDAEIKESLMKDTEIPPGDFKLESNLSVVDVNVGKMIADLLGQADLNLFGKDEKAS